jgi:hypothetical protein
MIKELLHKAWLVSDFLGYRFFHNRIIVRKSIIKKFKKKLRGIKKSHNKLKSNKIINVVMSYYGWLKYADTGHFVNKYFDNDLRTIFDTISKKEFINNPLKAFT